MLYARFRPTGDGRTKSVPSAFEPVKLIHQRTIGRESFPVGWSLCDELASMLNRVSTVQSFLVEDCNGTRWLVYGSHNVIRDEYQCQA